MPGVVFHEGDAEALDQITGPDDHAHHRRAGDIDPREAKLNALSAELDEKREALDRLRASLDEREKALAQAQAELGDRRAEEGGDLNAMDLDAYARELRERADALNEREADVTSREQSLAEGLGDPGPAGEAGAGSTDPDEVAALRAEIAEVREQYEKRKAQMMKADEIIKGRRQKIRGYLAQLREQAAKMRDAQAQADSSQGQAAGLEKERRNLVEVKKFLEFSESEMVRRWSGRSASNVAAVIVFAIAAAATSSYFAARHFVQPVWQGTMAMAFETTQAAAPEPPTTQEALEAGLPPGPVVEPGVESSNPASETELTPQQWMASFRQRLFSTAVMQATLDNLDANLDVRLFNTPDELATHLGNQLEITGTPKEVSFSYATTDRLHTDDLLENLGHAIVGDQLARGTATGTVLKEAQRSRQPVRDDTNLYMAAIFLAQIAAGLLLTVLLRVYFKRARRVLHPGAGGAAVAVLAQPID